MAPPARELSVGDLLEVGDEVGIAPDSVLLGLAEERLPDGSELRPRRDSPLWHKALVETRDALEVAIRLPLPPARVVPLLDEVMARDEHRMVLEDRIAEDPDRASVSVYRKSEGGDLFQPAALHSALHLSDGRVLAAAVTPDPGGGSRVRLRMPLYERTTNLTISALSGVGAGAGGLSLGTALGELAAGALLGSTAGFLPLVAVAVPAVAGAYLGVGAGILGFRQLQKWGFGKGQTALNRLARTVEMEAARPERALPGPESRRRGGG